ncbi:MAG: MBL fold metallo-hydrolase [Planctomycetota bacterium]
MPTARLGITASPPRLHFGDLTITLLDGGGLSLDGGAMFGIIPKPLWSRLVTFDDANRIPLATTCFLVETGGKRVLVETGTGPAVKFDEKERGFFNVNEHWILPSLAAIGLDRDSIDLVILTHLHFDHAGGGTMPDGKGGFSPTFPRAKYVVQRGEWDDAVSGHAVMTGTYRKENLAPLESAGVLSFVSDGDADILPGLRVRLLPGHTRHQQGLLFDGGGRKAFLPADLIPTAAHVGLRYNMAYDLMPYENMVNKQRTLEQAAAEKWTLLLGQDPVETAWTVRDQGKGRFALEVLGYDHSGASLSNSA